MYLKNIKKKWKKRSATLPRHQQRLHFCMRATFSHLLYVCLECLCVCVCVCVATSCWLQQAPAMCCCWFYPLFVCVCVSVAPFTVFHNSFRGGAQKHSFVLLLMHYTVSRKYYNLVYLFIVPISISVLSICSTYLITYVYRIRGSTKVSTCLPMSVLSINRIRNSRKSVSLFLLNIFIDIQVKCPPPFLLMLQMGKSVFLHSFSTFSRRPHNLFVVLQFSPSLPSHTQTHTYTCTTTNITFISWPPLS